jgi:hypothetical protein
MSHANTNFSLSGRIAVVTGAAQVHKSMFSRLVYVLSQLF